MHGCSEDKCELSVTRVLPGMNSKLIGAGVLILGEYISASVGSNDRLGIGRYHI